MLPWAHRVRTMTTAWFAAQYSATTAQTRGGAVFLLVFCFLILLNARSYSRGLLIDSKAMKIRVDQLDVAMYDIVGIETTGLIGTGSPTLAPQTSKPVKFVHATLLRSASGQYDVKIVKAVSMEGSYFRNGAGMDFDTLLYVRPQKELPPRLLTCDRQTGIVYEVMDDPSPQLRPLIILPSSSSLSFKHFACEWMALDGASLVIGAAGSTLMRVPWGLDGFPSLSLWGSVWNVVAAQVPDALPNPQCVVYSLRRSGWIVIPNVAGRGSEAIVIVAGSTAAVMHVAWPAEDGGVNVNEPRHLTDCKFLPNGAEDTIVAFRRIGGVGAEGTGVVVIDLNEGNVVVAGAKVILHKSVLGGLEIHP
eukprot:PhF_6_TR22396/c0_g1_i1/m.31800/K12304/CANT1; soluble calcium-activated nucleotidase 1